MAELSSATKNLIDKYSNWQNSLHQKSSASTIHVDEVAQKVAAFYEHIRTFVDWREEHLMRRAAIIRKLKRRFSDLEAAHFSTESLAERLVLELIRGGYFPNDKIEESKIADVQNIVDKYVFILKNNPKSPEGKEGLELYHKILEIASCEIEETLAPSVREMALIDYMFSLMKERIKVSEKVYARNLLKPEDKDVQIYIAVQQALFKLDEPIIIYNLLRYKYPFWNNPTQEELSTIAKNIATIIQSAQKDLVCPMAKKFYNICEKYDTAYLLIGDMMLRENFEKISKDMQEPALLESYIKTAYQKRLAELTTKIRRAAIYSTVSIFITKILSLLILEIILAKIFNGQLSFFDLAIDILIPTLLMAALVASIKPPSKKNINIVLVEVMKIFYQKDQTDIYEIKIAKKRGIITRTILSLLYLAGACTTFGAMYWVFSLFHFPISSIVINMIFIALILFAGTAVQKRAQELTIEEESSGFLMFITDILFLPITGMGGWMSNTWKQYNVVIAFFNALIDMPFGVFVEFLERWRGFIKERKEDMR